MGLLNYILGKYRTNKFCDQVSHGYTYTGRGGKKCAYGVPMGSTMGFKQMTEEPMGGTYGVREPMNLWGQNLWGLPWDLSR